MLSCNLIELNGKTMVVIMSDICICLRGLDSTKPIWKILVQDLVKTIGKADGMALSKVFARGCAQFQPDDHLMAFGLSNGIVVVVDLRNGDILHANEGWCSSSINTPIVAVASPRSARTEKPYLASVNENNEVLVFSKSGSLLHEIPLTRVVPEMSDLATCMTCLDSSIITGYLSGAVRIFDASTGVLVYDIAAHGRRVMSVCGHLAVRDVFVVAQRISA